MLEIPKYKWKGFRLFLRIELVRIKKIMKTPDVGKAWGSQCLFLHWGSKLYCVSSGIFALFIFFFLVCVCVHESFLKGLCFDLTILLAGCTLKSKIFHPNLIYNREKWETQCSVTENWVNRCYIHRWKVVQKLNIMLLKDIKDMRKHWRWEVIKQHDSSFIQCLYKYAQYLFFFGCGPF